DSDHGARHRGGHLRITDVRDAWTTGAVRPFEDPRLALDRDPGADTVGRRGGGGELRFEDLVALAGLVDDGPHDGGGFAGDAPAVARVGPEQLGRGGGSGYGDRRGVEEITRPVVEPRRVD